MSLAGAAGRPSHRGKIFKMSLRIIGLGTSVPAHCMSQAEALKMTQDVVCNEDREHRLARVVFAKSGVNNRHTAVPHSLAYEWVQSTDDRGIPCGPTTSERMAMCEEYGPEIAQKAAERALSQAGLPAKSVTHLVTVSCTVFAAPGTDIALFDLLGLKPDVERVNVGFMGCHGVINGLRVAQGLVNSQPNAVVLLSALELCSLHYQFTWDDEAIIGKALFADGSAALIGVNQSEDVKKNWTVAATGSCLLPDSRDAMTWKFGDHGLKMKLTSDVPRKIEEHLRPWMCRWLNSNGVSLEDVAHWVIHPGGPRILAAAESALSLTSEQTNYSHEILADLGNMSSPTVLFALERLEAENPHGLCVMLGFGPGLMAEACLLKRS